MAESPQGPGLVARVTAAMRYAVTGGGGPSQWFGPLDPLTPQAPESVRGRQWDYSYGINVNFRPRGTEPMTFAALKCLATHPIVAMLIQRQKDKLSAIDWQIKPRIKEKTELADDPMIATITDFLQSPDKEHDWGQWIGAILDQMLVIDAVSIYAAPTMSGGLYALQVLDGATIKPLIELGGRRPLAPNSAYQQILKGMPAVDYTSDELIYFPQVYRPDRVYGYSRVEQAHDLIEAAISRLKSQKGYFEFGNVGDGYFTAPENFQPDQIKDMEKQWNAMMQGSPDMRRNVPFLPSGVKWEPTKVDVLKDDFDEFLIRMLCFPFGVTPTAFMKQVGLGNGSASSDHEAAEEGGIAPLMQLVARLMSMIVGKWFQRPDLEFSFVEDREFDPKAKAEIEDIQLKNGSALINEVRDSNGREPIPGGDVPLITAGSTVIRLEDAIKEPAPPPPPFGGFGAPHGAVAPAAADTAAAVDEAADDEDLAKADAAAISQLKIVIAAYLGGKGKEFANALPDLLTKAAPIDDYSGRIEQALDSVDWDWRDFAIEVEPILTGIAVAAGNDAVSTLGLFDEETLKRVSARSTAYAQDRAAEMVGMKRIGGELVENSSAEWSISDATRTMLKSSITKAMEEGLSNAELKKTILESGVFSEARADMIARSETAIADVRGAAAGWIESGVVGGAQFDASPDCCDDCQAEDGTIVPLASVDDLELLHPGCRCSWSAVLTDEMPGDVAEPTDSED